MSRVPPPSPNGRRGRDRRVWIASRGARMTVLASALMLGVGFMLDALVPFRDALAAPAPARSTARPRGAPTDAFRIEHALTLRSYSDLTWSGDGTKLAFVVTSPDTVENANSTDLWLADLARGETFPLTRHPKGDSSPTFSPSGDTVAFISTRAAGEDARSQIYLMSLHGGEPWAFGSFDESVTEVRWSPDGRWLAYVKMDTLPQRVRDWRKKKWDHVVEDQRLNYPHLWVVEVATGKQRRLTSGEQYIWNARWSPDSRRIAYLASPSGKPDDGNQVDIGVVPVEGGTPRKLGVIGAAFAWSPDNRWIACATSVDRSRFVDRSSLWIAPAEGGAPFELTPNFDENAFLPSWSPTSDTLFFHSAQGVSTVVAVVPLTRGRASAASPVLLTTDRLAEAGAPVAAPNGRIAWVQSRPDAPDEIWIADDPRLAGRPLTNLNAAVSQLRLGATRNFTWLSSDGVRCGGLLIRPPGAPEAARLKTLVLLHGSPYGSRGSLGFQALPQFLAAQGYQVFVPNFRASGGYGTAFMMRERADWGGQDWRDVTTGIDTLVAAGLADGTRLGVFGRSYGGYLTAWAITQTERFDAACVFAGAVDLSSFYGQSDVQRYRAWEFEGFPWETPEKWRHSSPMSQITRVKTPTLIQVGENDARVPYPQGQQLYRALLGVGVPVEFVHYPREGHVLREPRHRADYMARMLAWWERWIR